MVKWREMRDSLQKQAAVQSSMASIVPQMSSGIQTARRVSRAASSRKGPLPPVPAPTVPPAFNSATTRLSMSSMVTTSSSDGIYSQPASDSSSTSSSAASLMTVSLSSLPAPTMASPVRSHQLPQQHQQQQQQQQQASLSLNDPYQQIDKFDYVDASPVGDELDGGHYIGLRGGVSAPPLPPRTGGGVSPSGKGQIISSPPSAEIRVRTHKIVAIN